MKLIRSIFLLGLVYLGISIGSISFAQCNGQFQIGQVCGNTGVSQAPPSAFNLFSDVHIWTGIQNFNGGATTPTQSPGNNTTQLANTNFVTLATRTKLTTSTTFFVNTSGSDSNTCLSSALPTPPGNGACATIQGALNKIYSIDANNQFVGISCASGQTFTSSVSIYGQILNPAFPQPVTLNCNNSTINVTGGNAIQVGQGAYLLITNAVLKTTSSGNCLEAFQNGQVFISTGVVFDGCAGFDMEGFAQGYLNVVGSYTIAAGSAGHIHATTGTVFNAANITVTLTGTPTWSDWFLGCSQSSATFFGVTFSGSGTGQRYLVHKACSVDTGTDPTMVQPETFLPGTTVGVVDASSTYLPYKTPTALSCGSSPAVASTATDWSGVVTVGTGSPTTCDILFNAAKTTAPNCTVVNDGQVALTGFSYISNNTGIAISFGAANSAVLHWTCTPTGV